MPHCLQRRTACKIQLAALGPQNGRRGLKGVYPSGFGHSKQLSLNKFFDPRTPSMRKVDKTEKKQGEKTRK